MSSSDVRSACAFRRSCRVLRIRSIQKVRHRIVSPSKRRIRGDSFIRNCARSVSSSSGVLRDGSLEGPPEGSCVETTLLAVNVATTSVLALKSCTRNRVVCAHRSNDET